MSKIHIVPEDILKFLDRSVLLADDRKEKIRSLLPNLGPEKLRDLAEILATEPEGVAYIGKQVMTVAAEANRTDVFSKIDRFILSSTKKLRKTDEALEHSEEQTKLRGFFDDRHQ